MDFTLNNMTLLGLTLAVGIVIDDAIVVLENIFRYIEEKDCTPFEAAIEGTREVALAVMATTLSLVVIFLPVAFMTGYARRFIYPVRLDDGVRDPGVDAGQLHADADAQLAVPEAVRRRARISKTKDSRFFRCLDRVLHAVAATGRWRTRTTVIAVAVAVFLTTFPLNRMVGRIVHPQRGHGRLPDDGRRAEGTSLEGMSEVVAEVSAR